MPIQSMNTIKVK